jgi:hypothetical protein
MSDEPSLRESLFQAEPLSAERQQRFRDELGQILEPRLPRSHRWYYILALTGSLIGVFGTACGVLFDAEHRGLQALLLLVWTAFAGWVFYILRQGAEPLRIMQGLSKALTGISFLVAGLLLYHGLQDPSPARILWALAGLLLVLLTSLINLWNRVLMAERTVREHVLRVEYRLAEMASRMGTPSKL